MLNYISDNKGGFWGGFSNKKGKSKVGTIP